MNPIDVADKLGDKERTILQAVQDGHDDTHKIGEATTLTNSAINYWIVDKDASLEDRGLVEVERVDGRVQRELNGKVLEFDSPKFYSLTDLGEAVVDELEWVETYQAMSEAEKIEAIRSAQQEVESNATKVSMLQKELRSLYERVDVLEDRLSVLEE